VTDGAREAGPTFADVGEDGVLRRILPLLPPGRATLLGPGDDAAVLAAPDGRVVASTDLMVQDRDFRLDWSTAEDVGVKAAAQNLADVAAMGAVPTALLVSLVAPPATPVAWAEGLARGLALGCAGSGTTVAGGDLSSGPVLMVSVTVLGDLEGREPVTRSGARPGDVVAVRGTLGRSAAGLALLEAGRPDVDPDLVRAHLRPDTPVLAGREAALAGATAMIDVSDGLLLDVGRIARASGVTIDLDGDYGYLAEQRRTLSPVAQVLGPTEAEEYPVAHGWVVTGGEEHSLVATFPSEAAVPDGWERIGDVRTLLDGWPQVMVDAYWDDSAPGWDHFRG
jgi:thiamine-monophosphate kinase